MRQLPAELVELLSSVGDSTRPFRGNGSIPQAIHPCSSQGSDFTGIVPEKLYLSLVSVVKFVFIVFAYGFQNVTPTLQSTICIMLIISVTAACSLLHNHPASRNFKCCTLTVLETHTLRVLFSTLLDLQIGPAFYSMSD